MTDSDGGPAFPSPTRTGLGYSPGLSLRDYFAGQAMQTLLAAHRPLPPWDVARAAYEMADAMLKERGGQ